jgi:hypothetical protein
MTACPESVENRVDAAAPAHGATAFMAVIAIFGACPAICDTHRPVSPSAMFPAPSIVPQRASAPIPNIDPIPFTHAPRRLLHIVDAPSVFSSLYHSKKNPSFSKSDIAEMS